MRPIFNRSSTRSRRAYGTVVLVVSMVFGLCLVGGGSLGVRLSSFNKARGPANVTVKAALVLSGPIGDDPFLVDIKQGFLAGAKRFHYQASVVESANAAAIITNFQLYAAHGYSLIIGNSTNDVQAMEQTAKQYPNIKFGIVDTIATGKNIRSVYSKEYEATFLVGYEAANMSKSHKVGVVSAEQVPLMEKYWGGYLEGINYAQKTEGIHTTMINRFVGSWDDPALSKTLTLQEISQGADFIYAASAGGEFGQYAACAEKHVYCVGLDNDYRGINPYVIDSEIKDVAPETEQLVVDFAHDASPWSTSTAYGLGNGMSLASVSDPKPISTNALGKPLLAKLKKLTAEIESGAVVLKDPCGC